MTLIQRALAGAVVAVALAAPAASAGTIIVPGPGCNVYVSVVDVVIYPSNPPRVGVSGNTGAWTDCP